MRFTADGGTRRPMARVSATDRRILGRTLLLVTVGESRGHQHHAHHKARMAAGTGVLVRASTLRIHWRAGKLWSRFIAKTMPLQVQQPKHDLGVLCSRRRPPQVGVALVAGLPDTRSRNSAPTISEAKRDRYACVGLSRPLWSSCA